MCCKNLGYSPGVYTDTVYLKHKKKKKDDEEEEE
jgi:hypothetical protein